MSRSHFRSVLGLLCATSLFAGCDSAVAPPGTPPAAVQIVSGDNQSGSVGVELAQPLAAKVLDAEGRAIPGQVVNFRVTAGGGSVFAGAGQTNDTGLVQERWTLGTSTADSQRVEVRAVDNATGAPLVLGVFKATPLAGPATTLAGTSGDAQSGPLGAALAESLAVKLTDQYDNPVPGDTVAWAATVGGGSLGQAKVTSDGAGIAKAQWLLGNRLDTMQIATATRTGLTSTVFTATPQLPSTATVVVTGGNAQTGVVGTALAESVAVKVTLAIGTPVAGATVAWSAPGSFSPQPSLTDTAGVAKAGWTLGNAAGAQTGAAQVGGLAPASFTATAAAGPPDTLVIDYGNLQTAPAGQALADSLAVKVADRFGNSVPGATVSWAVTGGGGSISPSSVSTDGNGLGKAQWTLGPSGSQALTATVSGTAPPPVTFRAGLTSSQPLQVRITSPLHASVARPTIDVAASCEPGRCTLLELWGIPGSGAAASAEGDTLQTTLSLDDHDGKALQLRVVAHGFLNETASDTATVYVEVSPALEFVTDVPGEIWEVQANRILYRQDSVGISLLKIRTRGTGADTVVRGEAGKFPRYGLLTPLGAMFVEWSGNPPWETLYEWRNGTLTDRGQVLVNSLVVRGQYAIWTSESGVQLWLRDVVSDVNTALVTSASAAHVASNGDAVYAAGYPSEIFRYRGGVTTQLSVASCVRGLVTDGTNVVFVKAAADCRFGQVYLHDPSGDIALTLDPDTRSSYEARDGWVTYTEFDANGVPQIWTRSPTGQTRQAPAVTFAGASEKRHDGLGPAGEVLFLVGNQWVGWRRFLTRPDGSTPVAISWSLGRPYWINGEIFLAIGRSLFKVH